MREMKFRGKSLTNGKWVIGDCIKHADNHDNSEQGFGEIIYVGHKVANASRFGAMRWTPVDPDTVGQYTGLKDCNGKEIYEGDFVQIYWGDDFDDKSLKGEAKWDNAAIRIYIRGKQIDYFRDFETYTNEYYEIIGNIHDNLNQQAI